MDIKNCPEKYDKTAGAAGILPQIQESVALIRSAGVDYEFRTTVVAELHEEKDFHEIGKWLRGAKAYYLQPFVDSGDILCPGLHSPARSELDKYLEIAQLYIPNSHLRGI
jgi:pyruvate formate lyase activating enzyme